MVEEEERKKNLYDVVTKGEVEKFKQLLQEDPYLLDEVSFGRSRNVVHIATMRGQVAIVEEALRMSPQLARDSDSQNSSPLHMAAEQGSYEIARILAYVALKMCYWRDGQGMNPIHAAAINGNIRILKELMDIDLFPAMERVQFGQTVLHLCVKHRQFTAFEVLVEKLEELLHARDDNGETVLHLAVRCHQLTIIRFLVESNIIRKQTLNFLSKRAVEILKELPSSNTSDTSEIERVLISLSKKSMIKGFPKLSDTTMVTVVLIATMAFQAVVSPPGGVWQDDTSSHRAGDAVMATTHPKIYKHFVRANTTAFVSSLITIFLITTKQPSGKIYYLLIDVCATWVSLASIAVSYGASLIVITPNTEKRSLTPVIVTVAAVSVSATGFIMVFSRLRKLYSSWTRNQRQQENPTTDSRILRVFEEIERKECFHFKLKSSICIAQNSTYKIQLTLYIYSANSQQQKRNSNTRSATRF